MRTITILALHNASLASTVDSYTLFSKVNENKQCTTHWSYSNEFRYFYPLTILVEDKIITDQHGLYTSGGSTAYWNLLLHLTEKFTNRSIAIRIAKYFVIDLNKSLQSPFIVFQGLKDHSDQMVLKIQEYLEQHYEEKFNVDELAARGNCSRRTFERRFSKATRHTLTEYIQKVKMEAAKKQLESSPLSVNEIMLNTGYADIHSFRKVFRKVTGMTPADYRKKYNK